MSLWQLDSIVIGVADRASEKYRVPNSQPSASRAESLVEADINLFVTTCARERICATDRVPLKFGE